MKFQLLTALLALGQIELHSNLFGNKKPTAKFDEDQLQSIEDALAKNDNSDLQTTIANLKTEQTAVQEAVSSAFAENGLTLEEGQSVTDAIASLSAKCKEYGSSKNTHTFVKNDGKEKDDAEDTSANYAHNQVFDESKYTTLK